MEGTRPAGSPPRPEFLPGHTDEEIIALAQRAGGVAASRTVFYRTTAILSIALLGFVGYFGLHQSQQADENVKDINNSQVQACEASLRPGGTRYILARHIQSQVKLFENVAESLPPGDPLKKKLTENTQQATADVQSLLSYDCGTVFPSP